MTKRAGRRLPLRGDVPQPAPGVAERHPNDGWELADPMPVWGVTERAMRGLVKAILPPSPAPRSPELDEQVLKHIRRMIAYTPTGVGLGILAMMHMVDLAPIWRGKALARLQDVAPDRASEILRDMEHSRWFVVRLMLLAPKALCLSTYFDLQPVHDAMDYEPRGVIRDRIARREQLMREEQRTDGSSVSQAEVSP